MNLFSIDEVCEAYERNAKDLEFLNYEYALEESLSSESSSDTTETSNKPKFVERFAAAVKKLQEMIARTLNRLGSSIGRVLQSDKGFREEMRKAETNHKPLEAIKLIMFQYVDQVLNEQYKKFKDKIFGIIDSINLSNRETLEDQNSVLHKSNTEIELDVLSSVNAPNDVKNMASYYFYIRKQFRGQKKELLIKGSNIKYWIRICEGTGDLETQLRAEKNMLNIRVRKLNDEMKRIIHSNESSDKVRAAAIKNITAVGHLFNIYSTFINVMIELKIEQMMTARIVVKRILQF